MSVEVMRAAVLGYRGRPPVLLLLLLSAPAAARPHPRLLLPAKPVGLDSFAFSHSRSRTHSCLLPPSVCLSVYLCVSLSWCLLVKICRRVFVRVQLTPRVERRQYRERNNSTVRAARYAVPGQGRNRVKVQGIEPHYSS